MPQRVTHDLDYSLFIPQVAGARGGSENRDSPQNSLAVKSAMAQDVVVLYPFIVRELQPFSTLALLFYPANNDP